MIDFDRFVLEQQESLRRFLLSLCEGNQALADDLAQESFIKAYLAIHTFSSRSKLSTWLFRIAYNNFIDYIRKRRAEATDIESAGGVLAEDGADAVFEHENLYMAIRKLSDQEKAVVLLFYMEDKPIREIAKILDKKEGAIKVQLSRAREHIREFLKSRDNG